ncbi:MAG: glycosyltransferase family 9 protein [Ignavibacteriaceae bacterium]|nr:glycosyltransferase family 9 protein [Ignavibacteriaceae bacterium]
MHTDFEKNKIKKILCIKPRGIGDIVLSTIILDSLHAFFNEVKIDYLVESFAKQSVEFNPLVNKVLTMEKTEFPLKVAMRVGKEKYDMLIDLWSNPRSAQITFLSGVKYRVGFSYRGRKYAYNIRGTESKGTHHSAEHNLELLKAIDIPIISKKVHYYVSENNKRFASEYFNSNNLSDSFVVGIIPAGGWESKRCDAVKWVEICNAILEKRDVKFLILWGPGDESDADYIKLHLNDKALLAPKTELAAMTGLMSLCKLIIANDSGPMHLSAAMGIPTLGIFGPTNPKAHGPYSPNSDYVIKEDLFCIICNKLVCPYKHECMLDLPVEMVLEKIEKILTLTNLK